MKKAMITLILLGSLYNKVLCQDCPPQNIGKTPDQYQDLIKSYCENGNGISTNPDQLLNPACPDLKNDFEWRIKQHPSIVSLEPEYFIVYDEHSDRKTVRNPFNDPSNSEYRYLSDNHNSNYQPEDGWELLKKYINI